MPHRYAELAFTPAVEAAQEHYGVRHENQRLLDSAGPNDRLGERERAFIERRDSFYLATVSETGWPYVQHRGGPPGFLKVLDDRRLAFADFRGNKQYISFGNLANNDRAALFLMDYPHRLRLKILARLRMQDVPDADAELVERLRPYPYRASMERVAILDIEAFDWNCSQHITPRYTEAHLREATASLHARISELEALLATRPPP
jgi:predicted pyridoxine 5'-phosphate oxidase superfamily flavin-nucleotide-binding protein